MRFLLLIQDGGAERRWSEREGREAHERMDRFRDDLKARGVLEACDALRPDSEGARVEVRNGERIVVDGPFAESKEIAGGFFLVACASKAEAIDLAAKCPAAEWATVEVRQIRV